MRLWIGTGGGLVRLARDGSARLELVGARVEALSESRGGVAFVGTRGDGLFARYAGAWRRIDATGHRDVRWVSDLAPGAGGALWLTAGGRGLFRAGG